MVAFTSDQWVILALVFALGFLIGAFLLAGSGRKWKTRYREEVRQREELEERHRDREREWDDREKDWRERDSLRGAALRDSDRDGDGVRDDVDRRPTDDRRA
ncbi:MAG: hypothetical protein H0W39_02550 [Sphingomonas sp.]|nr:hypothetical protein [Sphingomonas sp.]